MKAWPPLNASNVPATICCSTVGITGSNVIQKSFPRLSRCSCKGTSFNLRFDYRLRNDGDVEAIHVWTTCTSCGKAKRQMTVDIDYGPTGNLIAEPLVFCQNPRVLYDLREITLYAERRDVARIAAYLNTQAGCVFQGCVRERDQWVVKRLSIHEVSDLILPEADQPSLASPHFWIYASPATASVPTAQASSAKDESAFWKRNEIIRISSPTQVGFAAGAALLYYLQFSNEYVEDEKAVPKSAQFRKVTADLLDWLATQFISWRGPHCFDNPRGACTGLWRPFSLEGKGAARGI